MQPSIGDWCDDCMGAMCIRYGPGSADMPPAHRDRVLVLVGHFLDGFIVSRGPGGFYPYYADRAAETADALEEIGLPAAARLLHAVNGLFPSGCPPVDVREAERLLGELPPSACRLWGELARLWDEWVPGGERVMVERLYAWYYGVAAGSAARSPGEDEAGCSA